MKYRWGLVLLVIVAVGFSIGCSKSEIEESADKAGAAMEDAAHKTGEALDDPAEAVGEAADEVAEGAAELADDAAEAGDDAVAATKGKWLSGSDSSFDTHHDASLFERPSRPQQV